MSKRSIGLGAAISLVFLVGYEHVVQEPYVDIAGVKTVCAGETKGVEDRTYTRAECLTMLAERVAKDFAEPLSKCIAPWESLAGSTQAALISWAYNVGINAACKSRAVTGKFNDLKYREGCDGLMQWNKARVNGRLREVRGLTIRRADERKLCLEALPAA